MYAVTCFFFLFFALMHEAVYGGSNLKSQMKPTESTIGVSGDGFNPVDQVLAFIKNFLFDSLWILGVGLFLYFGYRLIAAQGNSEELKKTLKSFLYVVIGLAIIPLALVVVKIISSLNL